MKVKEKLNTFASKADESSRSVLKALEKSQKFYESSVMVSFAEKSDATAFPSPEQFRNERYRRIIEECLSRDERIRNAKVFKEKQETESKRRIHDNINRKSKGYREALARLKAENLEFNKKLKYFFVALNAEMLLNLLSNLASEGFLLIHENPLSYFHPKP